MNLFRHRPLAAACTLFIIALFAAYFCALSWLLVLMILCGTLGLFFVVRGLVGGFSYRRLFLLLISFALFFGCGRAAWDKWNTESTWDSLYDRTLEVELTISEVLYANTYGTEVLVEVEAIGGEQTDACAVLRVEEQLPFYVGDRVRATLTVHRLDHDAFSDSSEYRYLAEGAGAVLVAESAEGFVLLEDGTDSIRTRLLDLRAVFSHRIAYAVGGDEGKLLAAMLLGDRDLLADQTTRDFRLSGVSHLLALSGLHLIILVGALERVLYLLRVRKGWRIALLLPLCFFYLMLTGCNYSLLRALIMLGFVYLSALLREDNDSLTSLLIAGAVILAFTPYAIFSLSFQMTMLATFGILAYSKLQAFFGALLPKGKGKISAWVWRAVRFVGSSLLLSISTTVALLPVLWLTIGQYSLMTPLSNLLLVPLAPFILFGALLVVLLPFSFVGAIAALPATLALWLTGAIGSLQAMISLQTSFIPFIVIPVLLVSAILLCVDLKQRYPLAILPALVCMLAFVLSFCLINRMDQSLSVVYRQDGNNEGLVLVRGSQSMICDLSNTSLSQLRADWSAAQEEGATELSVLLLTHYHGKSAFALSKFLQSVLLHELWLPSPCEKAERDIFSEILAVAIKYGVRVTVYDTDTPLTVFGSGKITLSERLYTTRSVEAAFSLSLCYAEHTVCYHTASLGEYLAQQGSEHTCAATHLILGAHGPVAKQEIDISALETQSVLVADKEHLVFLKIGRAERYLLAPNSYKYVLE